MTPALLGMAWLTAARPRPPAPAGFRVAFCCLILWFPLLLVYFLVRFVTSLFFYYLYTIAIDIIIIVGQIILMRIVIMVIVTITY